MGDPRCTFHKSHWDSGILLKNTWDISIPLIPPSLQTIDFFQAQLIKRTSFWNQAVSEKNWDSNLTSFLDPTVSGLPCIPSSGGQLDCYWTDPVSSAFLSCHWKECNIPWEMVGIFPVWFKMIKWRGGRGNNQGDFWGNHRTKVSHCSAQGENIAHFWCQHDEFEGTDSPSIFFLSCGFNTSTDMNCLMNSKASSPTALYLQCLLVVW